jgi:hypothetical protein
MVATGRYTPQSALTRINQQINAYQSTLHISGKRDGNSYACALTHTGPRPDFTPDVGGACDSYIKAHFPGVVPGYLK